MSDSRKLILHFDARNTVFVADKCHRLTVEQALNTYISGLVWGKPVEAINCSSRRQSTCDESLFSSSQNRTHQELNLDREQKVYSGETPLSSEEKASIAQNIRLLPQDWSCSQESPCLGPPFPGAQSVYKLLEKHLVKVPQDRGRLRRRLGNFTNTPEGIAFADLFINHLEQLRWPLTPVIAQKSEEKFVVTGNDDAKYHYVLPAFLKLIKWLGDDFKCEFSILIRTYGKDGPYVLKAINEYLENLHPMIKAPVKNIPQIDFIQRKLVRKNGKPSYTYITDKSEVLAESPREIYELWNASLGISGVVDDFNYWHKNEYNYAAAKPLWFDKLDSSHQHIIFDDNIRFEKDETNVVNLQELQGTNCRSLNPLEALSLQDVFYVQADLLHIISDHDYFIRKVQQCMTNFDKIFYN